jgi:NhaA family Na+:H+ antiporter
MKSGAVLILCAVVAMLLANSPWAGAYFGALHSALPLHLGPLRLDLTLHGWINDLLMAVFFFVVGLEIKRELLVGELNDARRAALPIAGALGGMIAPALLYAAFNAHGPGAHGWGIPMATDIAFSIGVLAILGARVPHGLVVFLTALAIVDDLGAVAVIALFYMGELDLAALAIALALAAALGWFGARRSRLALRVAPYLVAAPFLWYFMFRSGVHATIAGVLLGFAVPLGPLERLERALVRGVKWGVMPVFALANAGVALGGMTPASLLLPPAIGVSLGLVLGKPVGIFAASWLAVRMGLASLPRAATWRHLWGVGMIAGIGFTVALFVASLAFHPGDGLEDLAKIGVLVGSLVSGVIGTLVLGSMLPPKNAKPAGAPPAESGAPPADAPNPFETA